MLLELLVFWLTGAFASFLRVETGHRDIRIEGRDPYYGHYTRVVFTEQTCLRAVTIHCLVPLTGAEEIDLLYTQCENDRWRVAHYSNKEERFQLKEPIQAKRLSVTSRVPLSVIDLQVEPCSPGTYQNISCSPIRRHRHHHPGAAAVPIKADEEATRAKIRRKRQAEPAPKFTIPMTGSPHQIVENLTISAGEIGRIEAGARLEFADNTGIFVYGTLYIEGTHEKPVYLAPRSANQGHWLGVLISSSDSPSSLTFVNISGSSLGITVRDSPSFPILDHVIADENRNGFTFDVDKSIGSDETPLRVFRASAVNSLENGFEIRGKTPILLDTCLSASNKGDGFMVEHLSSIALLNSHSFSNSGSGISVNGTQSINLANSLIGANGMHGIRFSRGTIPVDEKIEVNLLGVNITGHTYNPAIEIDGCRMMEVYLNSCHVYDNHDGGLIIEGQSETCEIKVHNGNFTRNRGPTLHMSSLNRGTVHVEANSFSYNHMNARADREALINLDVMQETTIVIADNTFYKNTMESVIKLSQIGPNPASVVVGKNHFFANLAFNVVYVDVGNANVSYNYLNNQQSNCEITSGPERRPSIDDVKLNYWSLSAEKEILLRVCAIDANTSTAALYLPFANMSGVILSGDTQPIPKFTHLYNTITNNGRPYFVSEDLVVPEGKMVIIEPGTSIRFTNGAKLIVQGKLYANGSTTRPIRLTGNDDGGAWDGLVIEKNSTAILSDLVIDGADHGMRIDSPNLELTRVLVDGSKVDGIVVSKDSGNEIDFGDTTIRSSSRNGLFVGTRDEALKIRNLRVEEAFVNGVTFEKPSHNITIENFSISSTNTTDEGYGIKILEDPITKNKLERLELKNISLINQKSGAAGVFFKGSAQAVDVLGGRFEGNSVPAMSFEFQCSDRASNLRMIDSILAENTAEPLRVELGECASAQILGNTFERNSAENGGTLVDVSISPAVKDNPVSKVLLFANKFNGNTGSKSTLSLSNGNGNRFNGTVFGNVFSGNANNEAVVEVDSGSFRIASNEFRDPKTPKELLYTGNEKLDVSSNFWGTQLEAEIKSRLGCRDQCTDPSSVQIGPVRGYPIEVLPIDVSSISTENTGCPRGCAGHGTCTASGCLCQAGYAGADCTESLPPVCTIPCSHGSCSGSKCSCQPGWMGYDCSIAICPELHNCSGHGECTTADRCLCDEGYTGVDCSIETCSARNCFHGNCTSGTCTCETGWKGSRCSAALCSNRCAFNGICVRPEQCQCFSDYSGSTCADCRTEDCRGCDPPCLHGECDSMSRTCTCHGGWSGVGCDLCQSGSCDSKARIEYILPQTADTEATNLIVQVHGNDFPRDSLYRCIFGTSMAPGKFVSSSLIRCAIPEGMPPGRHVFTVQPSATLEHIQSQSEAPIHFTFTEKSSGFCEKGFELGPLCVCPLDRGGLDCQMIELIPPIDRQFITNQRANEAVEGQPYLVHLPIFSNSVIQIDSTAPGLQYDATENLIKWIDPIGSSDPYNISMRVWTPNGPQEISWLLRVAPSYTARIDGTELVGNTQRRRIFGRIDKPLADRPVMVRIRRDPQEIEDFLVKTDRFGQFSLEYTPDTNAGGNYRVWASHPGDTSNSVPPTNLEISWSIPEVHVIYNRQVTINELRKGVMYLIENTRKVPLSGWQIQMAIGNLTIEQVEQTLASIDYGERNRMTVKFRVDDEFSGAFTVILIAAQGMNRVIRQEVMPREIRRSISSQPSSLLVPLVFDSMPLVKLHLDTSSMRFSSPLEIGFDQRPNPFYVIATDPPLSRYDAYSESQSGLKIVLGGLPKGNRMNGTILILYRTDIILRIPYSFSRRANQLFNLAICLKDEQSYSSTSTSTNAQIDLVNSANKAVMNPRSAIVNGPAQIFTIYPGFYQLTVTSDTHQTYRETIPVSPSNDSFCVQLTTRSSNLLPIFDGRNFSIEKIDKNEVSTIPQLIFVPTTVDKITEEIEGYVDGPLARETYVIVDDMETELVKIKAPKSALAVGGSARFQVAAGRLQSLIGGSSKCDSILVDVPYWISRNGSLSSISHKAQLILSGDQREGPSMRLCDENQDPVTVATRSELECNCAGGVREKCRKSYKSAVGCGSGWSKIADDTVSLENIAMILHLLAECQQIRVRFDELKETISCVASMDAECPLASNQRRKREYQQREKTWLGNNRIPVGYSKSSEDDEETTEKAEISEQQDSATLSRALDVQAITFASQFLEFFRIFEEIFDLNGLKNPSTEFWNRFFESLADDSDQGSMISPTEQAALLAIDGNAQKLVHLWNNSVFEWSSGRIRPFQESSRHPLITYQQAKELITATDKLKSISRQNGAPDPFSMLHAFMGRVLKSQSTANAGLCAESHVIVEPPSITEGDVVTLVLNFKNLKTSFLNSIGVDIEWIRDDIYTPEVKFARGVFSYTGIHALDGSQSLPGGTSFQATAKYTTAPILRLRREVVYQPIIVVSYEFEGTKSVQKLWTDRLTMRPKPSLKVHYFVREAEVANYEVLVVFHNDGFVPLSKVRVIDTEIQLETTNKTPIGYTFERLRVDGAERFGALSYEIGKIEPGKSRTAAYQIKSLDVQGSLQSIQSQIMAEGHLLPVDEDRPLAIRSSLDRGLFVSPLNSPEPQFFFDPATNEVTNLIRLQNIRTTSSDSSTSAGPFKHILSVFANPESTAFSGSLAGNFTLPPMPPGFKLIRLTEIDSKLTEVQRNLRGPTWLAKENGVDHLNFIDSEAILPLPGNQITYEAIFADPANFPTPIFDRSAYRIQVLPESWPAIGSAIGVVRAGSPLGSELEYSLYSPLNDRTFSIDPKSGEIFVENVLRKDEEQCLIVEAKDPNGNSERVPLSINSGGPQRGCVVRETKHLEPLIHESGTGETSSSTTGSPWPNPTTQWTTVEPSDSTTTTPSWSPETTREDGQMTTGSGETSGPTRTVSSTRGTTGEIDLETTTSSLKLTETTGSTEVIHTLGPDGEPTEVIGGFPTPPSVLTVTPDESLTTFHTNRPDEDLSTLRPTDFPNPPTLVTDEQETTSATTTTTETIVTMIVTPDESPEPITRITTLETESTPVPSTDAPETTTFIENRETSTEYIYTILPDSTPVSLEPIPPSSSSSSSPTIFTDATTTEIELQTNHGITDSFPQPSSEDWQTEEGWSSSMTTLRPVSVTFASGSTGNMEATTLSSQEEAVMHACAQQDEGIWDLICDLSKLTRGNTGYRGGNQSSFEGFG